MICQLLTPSCCPAFVIENVSILTLFRELFFDNVAWPDSEIKACCAPLFTLILFGQKYTA